MWGEMMPSLRPSAEIAASAAEATGCRVRRLGAPRIPVGYAPVLEAQSRISADAVAAAVRAMLL